jgi:hypothetical protein
VALPLPVFPHPRGRHYQMSHAARRCAHQTPTPSLPPSMAVQAGALDAPFASPSRAYLLFPARARHPLCCLVAGCGQTTTAGAPPVWRHEVQACQVSLKSGRRSLATCPHARPSLPAPLRCATLPRQAALRHAHIDVMLGQGCAFARALDETASAARGHVQPAFAVRQRLLHLSRVYALVQPVGGTTRPSRGRSRTGRWVKREAARACAPILWRALAARCALSTWPQESSMWAK